MMDRASFFGGREPERTQEKYGRNSGTDRRFRERHINGVHHGLHTGCQQTEDPEEHRRGKQAPKPGDTDRKRDHKDEKDGFNRGA
jgi:hypothetical protein